MDNTTNKPSGPGERVLDEHAFSDFADLDESKFVEVMREAFDRLLEDSMTTFAPRYTKLRCTGRIRDKPALVITVGETEFQVIIVKTR
jgi:hypothetical protein